MKKHPILKIVIGVLAAILMFLLVINIIPPKKNVDHSPFVLEKGALPMIAAHRGGGVSNPENTLLAFREARSIPLVWTSSKATCISQRTAIWSTTTTPISTEPAISTAT